jgi:Protein of unknown function (DUF742)
MGQPQEDPRGALVRPYAVTRGRTVPSRNIAIEAILLTTARGQQESRYAGRDKQVIASLCGQPQSLAEIAAYTRLPLGVSRVLVADMVTEGLLALHEPLDARADDRMDVLERVLSGLRRL